jgi:hypothetical protein
MKKEQLENIQIFLDRVFGGSENDVLLTEVTEKKVEVEFTLFHLAKFTRTFIVNEISAVCFVECEGEDVNDIDVHGYGAREQFLMGLLYEAVSHAADLARQIKLKKEGEAA